MKHVLLILIITIYLASCKKEEPQGSKPFKIHIVQGNKELLYYGSEHSNNIENPMFNDIESSFVAFNAEYTLIEGGYDQNNYNSKKEAILDGELAFVSYLAQQSVIPKGNIEPQDAYIDSILLEKYTKEQILTMYVLRQIYQFQRQIQYNDVEFNTKITSFTNNYINGGTLPFNNQFTFNEILDLINSISELNITNDNWKDVEVKNYVYNGDNIVSEIYNEVLTIRDNYAIDFIILKFNEYDKIFVIMGSQHLKNQKEKLRTKMSENFAT